MYPMTADRRCPLHTLQRRIRNSGPSSIRAPTWQLSADVWLVTDEPYLVLEVPAVDLPSLSAGFETALDGMVTQVENPDARIERHPDMVVLVLCGRVCRSVLPFEYWPADGPCQIIVVETGLLHGSGPRREEMLADLINSGCALVAFNEICAPRTPS